MRVCLLVMLAPSRIHYAGFNFQLTEECTSCIVMRMENLAAVGKRLARERLRQGMSQEALATRIGLGQSTVSRVEAGASNALSAIDAVASALGLGIRIVLTTQRAED
jgi:ribosome-binding protein aMBF1 (putative translation factor)